MFTGARSVECHVSEQYVMIRAVNQVRIKQTAQTVMNWRGRVSRVYENEAQQRVCSEVINTGQTNSREGGARKSREGGMPSPRIRHSKRPNG